MRVLPKYDSLFAIVPCAPYNGRIAPLYICISHWVSSVTPYQSKIVVRALDVVSCVGNGANSRLVCYRICGDETSSHLFYRSHFQGVVLAPMRSSRVHCVGIIPLKLGVVLVSCVKRQNEREFLGKVQGAPWNILDMSPHCTVRRMLHSMSWQRCVLR
jgi:hypothetical protein